MKHNDRKIVKVDTRCGLLGEVECPQQSSRHKPQLHPGERSPQTAVESDAEGFARSQLVIVILCRTCTLEQPAFRHELISIEEQLA